MIAGWCGERRDINRQFLCRGCIDAVPSKYVGMNDFSMPSDWKERLTTVTPFSRYFAIVLFIALPFVGAYLGASLGAECDVERVVSKVNPTKTIASAPVTEVTKVVELRDLDPVQGGYNVLINSDRTISVERKRGGVDAETEVYESLLFDEEFTQVASFFAQSDWGGVTSFGGEDTNESLTTIVLYDRSGAMQEVSQPYRSMTPEFKEAYDLLVSLAKAPLEE